jgi:spermidine synthase
MQASCSKKTYFEEDGDMVYIMKTTGVIVSYQTDKARIDVVPTKEFGHCLYIDGELQLASADEYIYHEMLVHPALCAINGTSKRVCVIGGGDCCAIREILKWGSEIERIDCIDWDAEFVDLVKNGSIPPLYLETNDKIHFEHVDIQSVIDQARVYDVIYLDLLDPRYSTEGDKAFWKSLMIKITRWLAPKGVLIINGGGFTQSDCRVQEWLVHLLFFEVLGLPEHEFLLYKCLVPSFRREWCFFMIRPKMADLMIQERDTRYFDADSWLLAKTWTKDYDGILPIRPVKLRSAQPH